MGPRHGRFDKTDGHPIAMPGHSVPLSALGGLILVFGFFACNGTKRVLKYNLMLMMIIEHFMLLRLRIKNLLCLFNLRKGEHNQSRRWPCSSNCNRKYSSGYLRSRFMYFDV